MGVRKDVVLTLAANDLELQEELSALQK